MTTDPYLEATTFDVVVVGSGAAGLSAAITSAVAGASVLVVETAALIGGTTAFGGGGMWIPCNSQMHDLKIADSRNDALTYVRALMAGEYIDEARLEAYIDECNPAIEFLMAHSPLTLSAAEWFADYYFGQYEGSKSGGRTMNPELFNSRISLGDWDRLVRISPHYGPLTQDELHSGVVLDDGGDPSPGIAASTSGLSRLQQELIAKRRESGMRTLGESLAACLLRGALDAGVHFRLNTRVDRLVVNDTGAVSGVQYESDGDTQLVETRHGVVLACGGFEWNADLVQTFLGVPEITPLSPPHNRGDGLVMGLAVGGSLENMTTTWGFPATYDEHSEFEGARLYGASTPRHEAGCIAINSLGHRFVNEGVSYMDVARTHRAWDASNRTYANGSPAWLVFDQRVRQRAELSDLSPADPTPDWVLEADTVAQLAEKMGIDPVELRKEVERFNSNARAHSDPDFGVGTLWFEGVTTGGPRPEELLAPVDSAPFFAMRMYDGALGTAGGLRTDRNARVLRFDKSPIDGLYAVGNTAASVFGQSYPGGGATLGPAVTFGYLAGLHITSAGKKL